MEINGIEVWKVLERALRHRAPSAAMFGEMVETARQVEATGGQIGGQHPTNGIDIGVAWTRELNRHRPPTSR